MEIMSWSRLRTWWFPLLVYHNLHEVQLSSHDILMKWLCRISWGFMWWSGFTRIGRNNEFSDMFVSILFCFCFFWNTQNKCAQQFCWWDGQPRDSNKAGIFSMLAMCRQSLHSLHFPATFSFVSVQPLGVHTNSATGASTAALVTQCPIAERTNDFSNLIGGEESKKIRFLRLHVTAQQPRVVLLT